MHHPLRLKLERIRDAKQSNLVFSADISDRGHFFAVLEQVAAEIVMVKTHVDIVDNFDSSWCQRLCDLAKSHNFLILEDRKFADIGSTVQRQYQAGTFRILEWADLVTVHGIAGAKVLEAIKEPGLKRSRGCLLLAQMSSQGNLLSPQYCQAMISMAAQHQDFVLGFIAQEFLQAGFLHFTPGISRTRADDPLGQGYSDPTTVLKQRQSDYIIVGRDIYNASSPQLAAQQLRLLGWSCLLSKREGRVHSTFERPRHD